ncbi:TBC1 domain family member 10B-like [Haliotis cracherodii]|uniref:TBC1 domain family member 10B-like n=1 Tax=Haliotis cracherodii TaxID=6455 RepID=UPI0039EBFA4C
MANANPGELMDSASDGSDDEGSGLGKSSANGSVVANVDRYGFMGGKQYTNPDTEDVHRLPPEILRKREIKWLDMFENWEKWMSKRFKKVKDRCRKGIPASVRPRAWQFLCGSKFVMDHNKGRFEKYLQLPGDPKSLDEITKDLHRQFPLHEMFSKQGGYGQEDLFLVLKAYTVYNPAEGYCQAHAPIAAVLLMHMPAEQAFWCLVAICEKYLPGYYSPGLEAIQLDGDVLFGLLKKTSPAVYKHLKKQRVEPIMYMTEWFMCVFTRNLPWACVLRIWDMFLCEGVKVMFRIALVLIKMTLSGGDKLAECTSFYETLEKLRNIPMDAFDEETLARESLKLNINERDMEKEHQRQIVKRRKEKEKGSRSNKKNKT